MATNTNNNTDQNTGLKFYDTARENAKQNKMAYYKTLESELNNEKTAQEQMASITLDKLQKYLPNQLKALGLSNSGASESTLLKAHSNYMNTMADISSNYNSQKNELERYKLEDLAAIDEKYDEKMEAASFENYNLFEQHVQSLLGKYKDENGKLSTSEKNDILAYIDGKKEMLTDEHYERLKTALDGYVASGEEQAAVDTLQSRSDNKVDVVKLKDSLSHSNSGYGDNFTVTVGTEEYEVEKGSIVASGVGQKITEAYGTTPTEGASVIYDGKLYMYLYNNDTDTTGWTVIQGRALDNSDFRKLCENEELNITSYNRTKNTDNWAPELAEYLYSNPKATRYFENNENYFSSPVYIQMANEHPGVIGYLANNPDKTIKEVYSIYINDIDQFKKYIEPYK